MMEFPRAVRARLIQEAEDVSERVVITVMAGLVALCHGVGGALEKKGIGQIMARMGAESVTATMVRTRPLELVLTAATTPVFVLGVFMVMVLGGMLLMATLSMGDGAKVGIFVGALSSSVYVTANVIINNETLLPVHLAGIAVAIAGSSTIAAGGFQS